MYPSASPSRRTRWELRCGCMRLGPELNHGDSRDSAWPPVDAGQMINGHSVSDLKHYQSRHTAYSAGVCQMIWGYGEHVHAFSSFAARGPHGVAPSSQPAAHLEQGECPPSIRAKIAGWLCMCVAAGTLAYQDGNAEVYHTSPSQLVIRLSAHYNGRQPGTAMLLPRSRHRTAWRSSDRDSDPSTTSSTICLVLHDRPCPRTKKRCTLRHLNTPMHFPLPGWTTCSTTSC